MSAPTEKRKLRLASGGALLLAGVILTAFVLPAEYGWDPLGTGAALGLLGMTAEGDTPLRTQSEDWHSDRIAFQLAPFEAVEYKYRLQAGASLVYGWRANGELLYDMHAEPDGAAPGYAESFAKSRGSKRTGSYTAPFNGIHGWFWQNRSQQNITVTLTTSGFYSEAIEMRDGKTFRYAMDKTVDGTQP